jgi:hypothetical protein
VIKLTLSFSFFQSGVREQMPVNKKHKGLRATQCKVDKSAVPFHVSVPGKCPINWQYWLHNYIFYKTSEFKMGKCRQKTNLKSVINTIKMDLNKGFF